MQKVSYMGNGATTEFNFNFPYFENSNIIVTKNGATATGYSITGTSAGENADIPYTGGKVVFETAPTALDSITIARSLPLTRIVDYQPLTKINSDTLNKDANYLMEVIKDRKDEIESLIAQYTEIADKESTTTLLARITELHNEIVALGNIATLRTDVTTNTNNLNTLDTRTIGMIDYVIASQSPTVENNHTWYRKYKSGWVEQGGQNNGENEIGTNTLPITMANTCYSVWMSRLHKTTADDPASISLQARNIGVTSFEVRQTYVAPGGGGGTGHGPSYAYTWIVLGMAA